MADFRSKNADIRLTNRLIKQGKLVTPLVASKSSRDNYLVAAPESERRPDVMAFNAWLMRLAKADACARCHTAVLRRSSVLRVSNAP